MRRDLPDLSSERVSGRQPLLWTVAVMGLGLLAQGTLLLHEWTQGHGWHFSVLVFTQIGTAIITLALALRLIVPERLALVTLAFTALCLGLSLSFAWSQRLPLEVSDYMIYLIIALIAVHGLPLARSAFVSVGSWLTLVLVDGRAGSVNIAALVYTGFLSSGLTRNGEEGRN